MSIIGPYINQAEALALIQRTLDSLGYISTEEAEEIITRLAAPKLVTAGNILNGYRVNGIVYNNQDDNTGELFSATPVTLFSDGSPMTDEKAIGGVYFKNSAFSGGGYSRRNFSGPANAKWFNIHPDASVDDTAVLTDILSENTEMYIPKGVAISASSIQNPLGAKIGGQGLILKPVVGGGQQLNSESDYYQYIFGREYMSAFHVAYLSRAYPPPEVLVVFSGDSTTAGDATTGPEYHIDNIVQELINLDAMDAVRTINSGHSSKTSVDWIDSYLDSDLALNPSLYVIRWGINDPGTLKDGSPSPINSGQNYPNRRDASDYIATLREGLERIRSTRDVNSLSIILMSPNSTSDTSNARDEKWYESIIPGIKQAARDYQCTFIDTYGIWRDSRNAAGWMDTNGILLDNAHIHPLNHMNMWIGSVIYDIMFPMFFRERYSNSNLRNYSYSTSVLSVHDVPNKYFRGMTISRTVGSSGFPVVDGQVITIANLDGIWTQQNFGYNANVTTAYYRTSINVTTWGPWQHIGIERGTMPTPINGWQVLDGADTYIKKNGVIMLQGNLRFGILTKGTVMVKLPVGAIPERNMYLTVMSTVGNSDTDAGSFVDTANIRIIGSDGADRAGNIELLFAKPNTTFISLSNISFAVDHADPILL